MYGQGLLLSMALFGCFRALFCCIIEAISQFLRLRSIIYMLVQCCIVLCVYFHFNYALLKTVKSAELCSVSLSVITNSLAVLEAFAQSYM